MKVSRCFVCLTAIFLFFSINNVSADIIWADGMTDANSGWYDANKVYDDDTLLCWAASAANILSWSGWDASSSFISEDEILGYFSDHTGDNRGWMDYAWDFWFDGTETVLGNTTYFDDSGESGFVNGYEYDDWYYEDMDGGADVMWDIADLLEDDYGVTVAIRGTMSHAITVWGVEVDGNLDEFSIWITDSDDNSEGIYQHDLVLGDNDRWYLQDFYGSNAGYIDEIQALKKKPTIAIDYNTLPTFRTFRPLPSKIPLVEIQNFTNPIILDENQRNILYSLPPKVVPEPATILLFGLGLLGLAGVSRRKK